MHPKACANVTRFCNQLFRLHLPKFSTTGPKQPWSRLPPSHKKGGDTGSNLQRGFEPLPISDHSFVDGFSSRYHQILPGK